MIIAFAGAGLALLSVYVAFRWGAFRWRRETDYLRARLELSRRRITPAAYDAAELEGLPAPVQRYFRIVLKNTQPMIAAARVTHRGEFNMGETQPKWRPFTSTQLVTAQRPGFDWEARIHVAPATDVCVHDAYVAGEGVLHASLFGLASLANIRGTPEAAQGELFRFLAEAVWYPTALLPSQGVRWEAMDDTSALATLTDGATSVSLQFRFSSEGLVSSVLAPARYRATGGRLAATPWEGRVWGYVVRDGMQVPLEGEVAWLLPGGRYPYWRGRTQEIVYEYVK